MVVSAVAHNLTDRARARPRGLFRLCRLCRRIGRRARRSRAGGGRRRQELWQQSGPGASRHFKGQTFERERHQLAVVAAVTVAVVFGAVVAVAVAVADALVLVGLADEPSVTKSNMER